jgi:hypothetical protein
MQSITQRIWGPEEINRPLMRWTWNVWGNRKNCEYGFFRELFGRADGHSAQLYFLLNLRILYYSHEHMGGPVRVSIGQFGSAYPHRLIRLTKNSVGVFGLLNGGTAGMIYVYLGTWIGFAAITISMAEMASMSAT